MILCIILNCRDCIFVSRNVWYDRWKIFDHSSSEFWPVAVAFHFVMPAGFLYLYVINGLYNVFVLVTQRGTNLPLRLTKGSFIFVLTGLFLISCRHSIGRLCLIWREFKKLQLISYFSLISLWLKKGTISFNDYMYLDDAFRSPVGPYIRSIWHRNVSVFPNSLVMYNFYGWSSDFLKFAPIMECFFIEFVSNINWDFITFEIIIQITSFVKFCCRRSPFSRFILQ